MRIRPLHRALLLALAVVLLSILPAQAAMLGCRSDPAVVLSNGLVLDLSADIAAKPWEVQQVVYTLHIPRGVNAVAILRTRTWPTSVERFVITADNAPGRYDSTTVVYTRRKGVAVTANLLVGLQLARAAGHDREVLRAGLTANGLLPNFLPPVLDIGL
jgi:hypothetical protein